MSCCGSTRRPVASAPVATPLNAVPPRVALPAFDAPATPGSVAFVYTGTTRLAADGPITRRRYRFEHPGHVVEVDARDAASFAAVPNLRRG